jgi:hypothetical protein
MSCFVLQNGLEVIRDQLAKSYIPEIPIEFAPPYEPPKRDDLQELMDREQKLFNESSIPVFSPQILSPERILVDVGQKPLSESPIPVLSPPTPSSSKILVDAYITPFLASAFTELLHKMSDYQQFNIRFRHYDETDIREGAIAIVVDLGGGRLDDSKGRGPAKIVSTHRSTRPIRIVAVYDNSPMFYKSGASDDWFAAQISFVISAPQLTFKKGDYNTRAAKELSTLLNNPTFLAVKKEVKTSVAVVSPSSLPSAIPEKRPPNVNDAIDAFKTKWVELLTFGSDILLSIPLQNQALLWCRFTVANYEDFSSPDGEKYKATKKCVLLIGKESDNLEAAWFDQNGTVWSKNYERNVAFGRSKGINVEFCLQTRVGVLKTICALAGLARTIRELYLGDDKIADSLKLTQLAIYNFLIGVKNWTYYGFTFVPDRKEDVANLEQLKDLSMSNASFGDTARALAKEQGDINLDFNALRLIFEGHFSVGEIDSMGAIHWKKPILIDDVSNWVVEYA